MNYLVYSDPFLTNKFKFLFDSLKKSGGEVRKISDYHYIENVAQVLIYEGNNPFLDVEGKGLLFINIAEESSIRHPNHYIVHQSELHYVAPFISSFFLDFNKKLIEELNSESLFLVKGLKKSIHNYLPTEEIKSDFSLIKKAIIEFYTNDSFSSLSKKALKKYFKTFEPLNYSSYVEKYESKRFIYLSNANNDIGGLVFEFNDNELEGRYILYNLLETFTYIHEKLIEFSFLKENLNTDDIPAIVFDHFDSIVYEAASFKELEIHQKDLPKILNRGSFIKNNCQYSIHKESLNDNIIYRFILEDNSIENGNSKDLGIITSSIAHELNNPLAGILAALEVFELEDLPSETLEEILVMKKTILRCRALVKTFLGFSKVQDTEESSNIEEAVGQALELAKFRMIESNLNITNSLSVMKNFEKTFNLSIMTMTIYIIINELVTIFSHRKLVENNKDGFLEFKFKIHESKIEIIFNPIKIDSTFLKNSKLFNHLIESMRGEFRINGNSAIVIL